MSFKYLPALTSGTITPSGGGWGISQARTDITTTGTINNQALATGWLNWTTSNASTTLTGLVSQTDGTTVIVSNNMASVGLSFAHESGSSTAANRFSFQSGVTLVVPPKSSIILRYNGGISRWELMAAPATEATAIYPGWVSTGSQTFGGLKNFSGSIQTTYVVSTHGNFIDVTNHKINDFSGFTATDFANRILYTAAQDSTLNWEDGLLSDTSNVASLSWTSRLGADATGTYSFDYGARYLYDTSGFSSLSWQDRQCYDNGLNLCMDWQSRYLAAPGGSIALDWSVRYLYDSTNVLSHSWGERQLMDEGALLSINYGYRELAYSSGTVALNWEEGALFNTGGNYAINFGSSSEILFFDGLAQVDNLGHFRMSTGSSSGTMSVSGGSFYNNTTQATSSSTTETDLHSYTLSENTFYVIGDKVTLRSGGTFAASAFTKRVRAYIAGTLVFDTGALAITTATSWSLEVDFIKSGSNSQKVNARWLSSSSVLASSATYTGTTATDTSTIIVKTTGTTGSTGGTNVKEEMFSLNWEGTP